MEARKISKLWDKMAQRKHGKCTARWNQTDHNIALTARPRRGEQRIKHLDEQLWKGILKTMVQKGQSALPGGHYIFFTITHDPRLSFLFFPSPHPPPIAFSMLYLGYTLSFWFVLVKTKRRCIRHLGKRHTVTVRPMESLLKLHSLKE